MSLLVRVVLSVACGRGSRGCSSVRYKARAGGTSKQWLSEMGDDHSVHNTGDPERYSASAALHLPAQEAEADGQGQAGERV